MSFASPGVVDTAEALERTKPAHANEAHTTSCPDTGRESSPGFPRYLELEDFNGWAETYLINRAEAEVTVTVG